MSRGSALTSFVADSRAGSGMVIVRFPYWHKTSTLKSAGA